MKPQKFSMCFNGEATRESIYEFLEELIKDQAIYLVELTKRQIMNKLTGLPEGTAWVAQGYTTKRNYKLLARDFGKNLSMMEDWRV